MKMRFEIRYALGVLLFFGTPLFAPDSPKPLKKADEQSMDGEVSPRWGWRGYENVALAGLGTAITVLTIKQLAAQRKAAKKRVQENAKRRVEGKEPLPEEEWVLSRWLREGRALFRREEV